MAAVMSVKEATGSGPTNTTVTNVRFCTTDGQDTSTYTLFKPSSGTNYSYIKTIFLNVDSGLTGTANNVKLYTDGTNSYGTGIAVKTTTPSNTYATIADNASGAQGTQGTTGTVASWFSGGTDVFSYTSASPLSVTGSLTATTGRLSYYVGLQMSLSTAVSNGTLSAETFTWRYDET